MGRYSNSKQAHGTSGSPQLSLGQGGLASKVGELYDKLMSDNNYKVSETDQTKHIKGSSNYNPNKSEFYGDVSKAQKLINSHKGKGEMINDNKERVDFGEVIGGYVNSKGEKIDTTIGIIHTSKKKGSHIVPARPKNYKEVK